jgi:hypothetical protein
MLQGIKNSIINILIPEASSTTTRKPQALPPKPNSKSQGSVMSSNYGRLNREYKYKMKPRESKKKYNKKKARQKDIEY